MKKRSLTLALAICILIFNCPITAKATTNGKTSADAVAWANNHASNASVLDYDGVYGAQCVDLIKYYYVYLGNSAVTGNGKDYATNSLPSGWSRIQYYDGFVPQPGDIAVWTTGGGGYGHVAIVISANASTMTVVEQNWVGKYCSSRSNASTSGIWGVIRPDFAASYADLGTDFTAPILNKAAWMPIENSYTESDKPPVRIQTENGKANQLWYFSRQSDGSYMISSCQDGKYLDVRDAGTGTGVVIQTCVASGSDAQKWYLYEKDGGYIIKSKLSGYVLDLVNNDSTSGNTLQTWEDNGTTAQIWAIYRGDECKIKSSTLTVTAGDSKSNTMFTWNDVYGESRYDVKIWKGTAWNGDAYHIEWGATSGYSLNLPAGTYQAYVDAVNYYNCEMSNLVTFTVSEHQHSYSYKLSASPTTSATGKLTGTCSKCSGTTTVTLPKLNTTDYTYKVVTAATCTANGTGRYTWKTMTYGSYYFDVSISKTGHSYTSKVTAPTCTAQGYTKHTCSSCGDSYKDSYTSALGHSYSYKVTTNPTTSSTGTLTGNCSSCSGTTTVTLPKLNTTDYTYKVTKEPSYTATGTARYTWNTTTYGTFYFDVTLDKLTATLTKIEVASKPAKTVYEIGESLDTTGLTLKATYSDGSTKTITSGFITSGFDSSAAGEKTVTVTYGGKATNFTITVEESNEVDPNAPQVVVDSVTATVGETVTVEVMLENNPGINSVVLKIDYDTTRLKLESAQFGAELGDGSFTNYNLPYITLVRSGNCADDVILVTITFSVLPDAEAGDAYVTLEYNEGDITNYDEEDVDFTVVPGGVTIIDYIPGDINGDGKVNSKDLTRLLKYISHEDVEVNEAALDVNGDGKVNSKDLTRLLKYISHEDVEIH